MQDDLAESYGAVEWGETQLPLLVDKFHAWRQANVGIAIVDLNHQAGKKLAVFRKKGPMPIIFNAGVGSMINSFRTALDLLCAALAKRNGKSPSRDTHFPFFRDHCDFIDPKRRIENKKWLSSAAISILKSLRPYQGGNNFLWSLHELDVIRKHERLLSLSADPSRLVLFGLGERPKILISRGQPLEDETPLFEFSGNATDREADLEVEVTFNEPGLPAVHGQSVFRILNKFRRTTTEIIDIFAAM